MTTYTCTICGHQYDPKQGEPSLGIAPGTAFKNLPGEFQCPVCGAALALFREE